MKKIVTLLIVTLIAISCRVSYQFNGASIDYNVLKTIQISVFQNQAPMVYPPLTQVFNEEMKDMYARNTRLMFTNNNPDLEIEGEIVRYDLVPLTVVQEDQFAAETRLTMTVRFRYRNNKNPEQNKEESITAFRDFSSDVLFTDIQDDLIVQLSRDVVDQIFNATLSNW